MKQIPKFDYSHLKPGLAGKPLHEAYKIIMDEMVKHYNTYIVGNGKAV